MISMIKLILELNFFIVVIYKARTDAFGLQQFNSRGYRRLSCTGANHNIIQQVVSSKQCSNRFSRPKYNNRSIHKSLVKKSKAEDNDGDDIGRPTPGKRLNLLNIFTSYVPLWTIVAAAIGVTKSQIVSPLLGSMTVMQSCLALLMLAMGLTITPKDMSQALKKPRIVATNAIYCYGMMPLLAWSVAKVLSYNTSETAGIVLLGSVSGGQASNLFTLLAGGDVALSVICTFSTTVLGVLTTPLLIKWLLGCSVSVNGLEVLKSVASLSLLPLIIGLSLGRLTPRMVEKVVPFCAPLGVAATIILVAGGAANSAGSIIAINQMTAVTASCLLPIIGGAFAFGSTMFCNISEKSRRALVIETFSKSPTLAYIIALKHFDHSVATIPAVAMVSLAAIGATVSSIWSSIHPVVKEEN
mmetsp:Transcript_33189/g.38651  ORF Transcript_33189/g.38651 Transcript_33189/m.38651 type:complete len:413 (-) Transcript_33189:447-1685(-)